MLCPMKFSAGCSAESKECDGPECMWYMSAKKTSYDMRIGSREDVISGCSAAFVAMRPVGNLTYSITPCDGPR